MNRFVICCRFFITFFLLACFVSIDTAIQPIPPGTNIVNLLTSIFNENIATIANFSDIACTPIHTAPFVINTPGVYCVKNDLLIGSGQTAITVLSNDVVLDLGGCSIVGQDASSTTGVQMGDVNAVNSFSNIVVCNGSIINTGTGVGCSKIQYGGVIASLNIESSSSVGIQINNSDNAVVQDVLINEGLLGIVLINGNQNTIIVRSAVGNMTGIGIGIDATSANTIIDGVKISGSLQGLVDSGNGLIVAHSAVLLNGGNAIDISPSASNTIIKDCAIENNDGLGIALGSGALVKNCTILSNGSDGIGVNAAGTVVIGTNSTSNSGYGINVSGVLAPTDVLIQNNVARNNGSGDYNNVIAGTLTSVGAIGATTGYWANIQN